MDKTPDGADSRLASDAKNSIDQMPEALRNTGVVTRIVLQSNINSSKKFEVLQDSSEAVKMPAEAFNTQNTM
jgi:hypothetical protein